MRDDILKAAADLVRDAKAADLILATAESCTGGGIGYALTAVAGSSAVFHGGIIAYDNRVKMSALNVPEQTLADHGAVSAQTARAMADGALNALKTDMAISVTGIAGPGGGSDEKPVGLVWIGLAIKDRPTQTHELRCGDIGRDAVREQTILTALSLLGAAIRDTEPLALGCE